MRRNNLALFVLGALVLAASVAVANHLPPPPPVSMGGELAYIRDHPSGALDSVDTEGVHSTYVAFSFKEDGGGNDTVERLTSRGRIADNVVFHRIAVPDGILDAARCFEPVQEYDRGWFVAEGATGRLMILNGVNAGFGLQTDEAVEAVLHVAGGHDVTVLDGRHVALERDGHTYLVYVHGGSLAVNGMNIVASLEPGALLGGRIEGYPATTSVMGYELALSAARPGMCD